MPARPSQRKAVATARIPKRKAGSELVQESTPVRLSTRVRTAAVKPTGRPKKRNRRGSSNENDSSGDAGSGADSSFKSEQSAAADPSDEEIEDDRPQSYSIPLPKARGAGDTPYEDNRIHPNTFLFLKDLKTNNNREWLKWHDKDFRTSLKDFETFIEQLSQVVMNRDYTIPELPKKDLIFRIYRDVRFSSDQTPYKPHFSAAWSRTGKKGPYAAYYVQLQPGGASFVGGGLWHPDGPALAAIREDIDQQPQRMKGALMTEVLRQTFFEKAKKDEKKVVAAFVATNAEGALKTKPKGFDADHKDINLLRLRNFTMGKKITDAEVLSKGGINAIGDIIDALVPWVTYLNSVVMPDPPGAVAGADADADAADDNDNEDEDEDEGEGESDSDDEG